LFALALSTIASAPVINRSLALCRKKPSSTAHQLSLIYRISAEYMASIEAVSSTKKGQTTRLGCTRYLAFDRDAPSVALKALVIRAHASLESGFSAKTDLHRGGNWGLFAQIDVAFGLCHGRISGTEIAPCNSAETQRMPGLFTGLYPQSH